MREYELAVIIHPDLEENATNDVIERIQDWIKEADGTVDKIDRWGKRKLAYPIQKQKNGQYFFFYITIEPSFVAELERNIRFLEPVIRFMTTSLDK
jgi:small subunit ribosomal protein S6